MIHLLPKNKNAKTLMLTGISILTLSACSLTKTESNNISAAQQSYGYMAQKTLNASEVNFSVAPTIGNEQILALFPNAPQNAFQNYLDSRFKSNIYGDGAIDISIDDVFFDRVRVSGGKDNILDSLMAYNDNYKYTLRASINVKSQNRLGLERGNKTFDVGKSVIMPSHFSLVKKEKHLQEFLDSFIADLDQILVSYMNTSLELTALHDTAEYGAGFEAGEADTVGYRYQDHH
ncbi:MAG: hypothetical protein VYC19_03710 [Pseudomonadota bacterium]|nr:hypothetical protein [Alphaproteobacteria bacterium]MEC7701835.1 hypothetical protein [Pseudomonadota bacterium]|tara:strand:+ start:3764 stop:4462 length:699 start_codon:yes stop_codon:yes gene_type:complete